MPVSVQKGDFNGCGTDSDSERILIMGLVHKNFPFVYSKTVSEHNTKSIIKLSVSNFNKEALIKCEQKIKKEESIFWERENGGRAGLYLTKYTFLPIMRMVRGACSRGRLMSKYG